MREFHSVSGQIMITVIVRLSTEHSVPSSQISQLCLLFSGKRDLTSLGALAQFPQPVLWLSPPHYSVPRLVQQALISVWQVQNIPECIIFEMSDLWVERERGREVGGRHKSPYQKYPMCPPRCQEKQPGHIRSTVRSIWRDQNISHFYLSMSSDGVGQLNNCDCTVTKFVTIKTEIHTYLTDNGKV